MVKRRKSNESSDDDVKPKVAASSDSSSSSDDDEDWNAKGTTKKAKRGRPPKKAKQEEDEKEEGEVEDDDSEDDLEEFNDGYDENLLGDEEDQKRLALMTEKEREQELFNRSEKREVLKTRFEIEKKLRMAKKKESKSATEAAMRSTERRRNMEDRRKVKDAIKGLRAEREKKKQKQQRLRTADVYSSDSDSDDNTNVLSRRKSSDSSSSSSSSSDDSDAENNKKSNRLDDKHNDDDDDLRASDKEAEEDWAFGFEHLNQLRLSRFKLEKWCHAPFFRDSIIGCFARILLGVDPKTNQQCYRVGQIIDVCETTVYSLSNKKDRTNKGLKLRHAKHPDRVYKIMFASNSPFTKSEYEKWYHNMVTDRCEFPTKEFYEKKKADVENAVNYQFKDSDIDNMIEEKAKFKRLPVNFAMTKTRLMKEKELAEQNGDHAKADEIMKKLDELEEEAKTIEKKRTQNIAGISYINERNRMRNIKEAEKALTEQSKSMKEVDDPFTRRKCTPQMIHNFKSKKNNSSTSTPIKVENENNKAEDVKSDLESLNSAIDQLKAYVSNDALNGEIKTDEVDKDKSQKDERPSSPVSSDQDNDLFNAHNFEINFDFNLGPLITAGTNVSNSFTSSSHMTPANSNISKPPNRRSLNLDEYKKKKGLI